MTLPHFTYMPRQMPTLANADAITRGSLIYFQTEPVEGIHGFLDGVGIVLRPRNHYSLGMGYDIRNRWNELHFVKREEVKHVIYSGA